MQTSIDSSMTFSRDGRSNSFNQDNNSLLSSSQGGYNSLFSNGELASWGMYGGTPSTRSPACNSQVFTFDNIQSGNEFGNRSPFHTSPDLFQNSNNDGSCFSYLNSNLYSNFEDDTYHRIDPFYLPSFHSSDRLLSKDQGLSPTIQKRSFRTDFPSLTPNLNYQDSSYNPDDPTPLTPILHSTPYSNHQPSPTYLRPPSLSEPSLYEQQPSFTIPSSPPKKQPPFLQPSSSSKSLHNSPQRPKRLARPRGGSPGSSDPSNELKIEDVKNGKDLRTTLMIKNIPNAFTREVVLSIVDQYCKNEYDFFYLPYDQKTDCNLGYGYINMLSIDAVVRLYDGLNNKKWQNTRSVKICSICYGRLQSGSESLAQYCSDWSVMTSDEKYHPLFFKEVMRMEDGKEVRCMERYTPKINLSMKTSI